MIFHWIKTRFLGMLDALRFDADEALDGEDRMKNKSPKPFSVISDGLKIRGRILLPTAAPSRQYPILVICHGIPGSGTPRPTDDAGYESLAQRLSFLGTAAVIFNFRGCGESEGNFDISRWPNDLNAVLNVVTDTPYVDPSRIILLGFSGGGATSIRVAAERSDIFGLASVSSPADFGIFQKEPSEVIDDFRDRGLIKDPDFPPNLDRWMDGFRDIEPRRWIAQFKGKHCLIMHGDVDELVPVEHAHELFEHAPAGTAELSIIPGGVHRLRLDPRCVEGLEQWIRKVLSRN